MIGNHSHCRGRIIRTRGSYQLAHHRIDLLQHIERRFVSGPSRC